MTDAEVIKMLDINAPTPGTLEYEEWTEQDLRSSVLITIWVFLGICNVFVGLRLYARLRIYKALLNDDYWLVGGLSSGLLSAVLATIAVTYGNGKHMPELSKDDREGVILYTTAAFCPGILFFGLPKMAIVTLLTRLLSPSKTMRFFLWGIVIFSQFAFVALIGLILGRCDPPKKMWNNDVEGECMPLKNVTDFAVFVGSVSAFVDVVLAVYPAIVFSKMKLSMRRKVGLSAALGIGSVGGAIAIYKTAIIPDGLGNADFSYHSAPLIIWTAVEGATHMVAASLPVLAPMFDLALSGQNPFKRATRGKPYKNIKGNSHEMSSAAYSRSDTMESGGVGPSESQVDILPVKDGVNAHASRAGAETPLPGPGQILCSNEITITYEEKRPVDPLEAMIRGYDTRGW